MRVRTYKVSLFMQDGSVLERSSSIDERLFNTQEQEEQIACFDVQRDKTMLFDGKNGFHYPVTSIMKLKAEFVEEFEKSVGDI